MQCIMYHSYILDNILVFLNVKSCNLFIDNKCLNAMINDCMHALLWSRLLSFCPFRRGVGTGTICVRGKIRKKFEDDKQLLQNGLDFVTI